MVSGGTSFLHSFKLNTLLALLCGRGSWLRPLSGVSAPCVCPYLSTAQLL